LDLLTKIKQVYKCNIMLFISFTCENQNTNWTRVVMVQCSV